MAFCARSLLFLMTLLATCNSWRSFSKAVASCGLKVSGKIGKPSFPTRQRRLSSLQHPRHTREPAGTGWNRLEPAGTGWNRLELAGTGWNLLRRRGGDFRDFRDFRDLRDLRDLGDYPYSTLLIGGDAVSVLFRNVVFSCLCFSLIAVTSARCRGCRFAGHNGMPSLPVGNARLDMAASHDPPPV